MAQKPDTTQSTSPLDTVKLALALLVLVAAIVAFYWFAAKPLVFRVLGLLAAVGIAVAVGSRTYVGRVIWSFIGDARTEVRKVVWPTRQETVQTTMVVIGLVLLVAIFLWVLDFGLLRMVRVLTGQGS